MRRVLQRRLLPIGAAECQPLSGEHNVAGCVESHHGLLLPRRLQAHQWQQQRNGVRALQRLHVLRERRADAVPQQRLHRAWLSWRQDPKLCLRCRILLDDRTWRGVYALSGEHVLPVELDRAHALHPVLAQQRRSAIDRILPLRRWLLRARGFGVGDLHRVSAQHLLR